MNFHPIKLLFKPKNSRANFLLINFIVIIGVGVLWRKDLIYHKLDFGLPILLYFIFSLIGFCISFLGYSGFVISYYWGLISFIGYYLWLWDSINALNENASIFVMTLFIGPFLLPPFPFFTLLISIGIDLFISMQKNKKKF
jgi:hypothetical protein